MERVPLDMFHAASLLRLKWGLMRGYDMPSSTNCSKSALGAMRLSLGPSLEDEDAMPMCGGGPAEVAGSGSISVWQKQGCCRRCIALGHGLTMSVYVRGLRSRRGGLVVGRAVPMITMKALYVHV
jgi:hypothetical protein